MNSEPKHALCLQIISVYKYQVELITRVLFTVLCCRVFFLLFCVHVLCCGGVEQGKDSVTLPGRYTPPRAACRRLAECVISSQITMLGENTQGTDGLTQPKSSKQGVEYPFDNIKGETV